MPRKAPSTLALHATMPDEAKFRGEQRASWGWRRRPRGHGLDVGRPGDDYTRSRWRLHRYCLDLKEGCVQWKMGTSWSGLEPWEGGTAVELSWTRGRGQEGHRSIGSVVPRFGRLWRGQRNRKNGEDKNYENRGCVWLGSEVRWNEFIPNFSNGVVIMFMCLVRWMCNFIYCLVEKMWEIR